MKITFINDFIGLFNPRVYLASGEILMSCATMLSVGAALFSTTDIVFICPIAVLPVYPVLA